MFHDETGTGEEAKAVALAEEDTVCSARMHATPTAAVAKHAARCRPGTRDNKTQARQGEPSV